MLLEEQKRLPWIAYDHANNAVVNRVAGRDRVDVDFRAAQRVHKPGPAFRAGYPGKEQVA